MRAALIRVCVQLRPCSRPPAALRLRKDLSRVNSAPAFTRESGRRSTGRRTAAAATAAAAAAAAARRPNPKTEQRRARVGCARDRGTRARLPLTPRHRQVRSYSALNLNPTAINCAQPDGRLLGA
eukprot:362603-Chlamydomonas_euryale.AAC.1